MGLAHSLHCLRSYTCVLARWIIIEGIITRVLAGYYYVQSEGTVICCRARGRLKKEELTPLVGDRVKVSQIDSTTGVLSEILPRRNELRRPAVANVTQMLVMAALQDPVPNVALLDRLLVTAEYLGLKALLVFNKVDLDGSGVRSDMLQVYGSVYPVFFISLRQDKGLEELSRQLSENITVLAGQSGVGKSTLINRLTTGIEMTTGSVSEKTGTGRHTTRHVELLPARPPLTGHVVDTPGFSRLELPEGLLADNLDAYFPEMQMSGHCRFGSSCVHLAEPGCAVKAALAEGHIAESRYQSYQLLYAEAKERERRY